ncbi:MAG: dephospho-CoA kinase [Candidatus Omnitrophota bacterium]|jgi:dephospho-CoA kinase
MYTIGLTGSPCSGKSEVLRLFKGSGARVVNSDSIIHQALKRGRPAYKKILKQFGYAILKKYRVIDRTRLRQKAFENSNNLLFLEKVLHPEVRSYVRSLKISHKASKQLCVFEIPLLFETGMNAQMNKVAVMKVTAARQQKNLDKRNMSLATFRAFMRRQWDMKRKIKQADFIIENNGDIKTLRKQVQMICENIKNRELRGKNGS